VFFQHFMGTLDDHYPALSDAFAGDLEVILFNNTGVASSSGTVPDTIEATTGAYRHDHCYAAREVPAPRGRV
jgi:hypothetical protein